MKTTVKNLVPALTIILIIVAFGNKIPPSSNQNIVDKNQEINAKQELSDSDFRSSNTELPSTFDFENYNTDKLPNGWSQYYTGSGNTEWKVINDNGNKVLAQLYSDNPNNHFNVVVNNDISLKDMELKVRIKGVTGNHDQGGGFVWRFIDKNNYYVVRENPAEDNMVLYKMENGKRSDLPLVGKGRTYGVDVPKIGNTWHSIKLVVKGDFFTIFMDGNELFQVKDDTFTKAGKVGLWTKADAVTYFDDFEVEKK